MRASLEPKPSELTVQVQSGRAHAGGLEVGMRIWSRTVTEMQRLERGCPDSRACEHKAIRKRVRNQVLPLAIKMKIHTTV